MEKIGKLEAARRQLDCAIRLLLENDDSLAVHTLAYAAFKVLFDLSKKKDGAEAVIAIIQEAGWWHLTRVPNFLKHADNDADEFLRSHSPEITLATLGFACALYLRLNGGMTPEMAAFHGWMKVTHPDEFNLPAIQTPILSRLIVRA